MMKKILIMLHDEIVVRDYNWNSHVFTVFNLLTLFSLNCL